MAKRKAKSMSKNLRRIFESFALAATLALLSHQAAAEEPVAFTTEPYPPLSYQTPDGTQAGVNIDEVAAIMKRAGLSYSIEILPWARALAMAETGHRTCVFSTARTTEREARFKWVSPLSIGVNVLVRRSSSNINPKTLDEAKTFIVGTHRKDYTEDVLRQHGFPKIDISADFDTTLRKLMEGRVDLMPMPRNIFLKLQSQGYQIEKSVILSSQQFGIACNLDTPDDVIARMQAALDTVVADGTEDAIRTRYGVPLRN